MRRATRCSRIRAASPTAFPPTTLCSGARAAGDAFVWEPAHGVLLAFDKIASVPLSLLKGIDAARDTLLENTRRFADSLPANNALLWGARGRRRLCLGARAWRASCVRQDRKRAAVAAEGDRCGARHVAREYAPLRRQPSRQQRSALGRARQATPLSGSPRMACFLRSTRSQACRCRC